MVFNFGQALGSKGLVILDKILTWSNLVKILKEDIEIYFANKDRVTF
jgi:hypothetical protein